MLDLDGDEQIGSLSGVGTVDFSGMLTDNQTTDTVFSGDLLGNGNLEKSGAGSLTLSGKNSFTGGIEHKGGTLVLASANAAGQSAIFNGAILNITSNLTGSGLFSNQNGGVASFGSNAVSGFAASQTIRAGLPLRQWQFVRCWRQCADQQRTAQCRRYGRSDGQQFLEPRAVRFRCRTAPRMMR